MKGEVKVAQDIFKLMERRKKAMSLSTDVLKQYQNEYNMVCREICEEIPWFLVEMCGCKTLGEFVSLIVYPDFHSIAGLIASAIHKNDFDLLLSSCKLFAEKKEDYRKRFMKTKEGKK